MLRLHDRQTNKHVIVHDDRLYADSDGDGRIAKSDQIGPDVFGPRHDALVEAARYIVRFSDPRVPGITNADGRIVSGGILNAVEREEFESGRGTTEQRGHLAQHLSFFDRRNRGAISPADNYRGWRNLGFGRLRALMQTAVSAGVFGWRRGGTIVIAEIG